MWALINMVKARALAGTNIFQTTIIINWDMVVKTHTEETAQEEFLHILQPSLKSPFLIYQQVPIAKEALHLEGGSYSSQTHTQLPN